MSEPTRSEAFTPENVRAFIGGSFPGDLGIEPLEIEDSFASGRIVVDQRHLHPGGYVHGGVWTALGDTVAAWATFRNIPPEHNFTTIELKLNVFSAGLLGDEIVATGTPLHAGKSTVVIEVKIERIRGDEEPRLAANLIVTQFVLPPRDCKARQDALAQHRLGRAARARQDSAQGGRGVPAGANIRRIDPRSAGNPTGEGCRTRGSRHI